MRVTQKLYSNIRDISIRRWNKVWGKRAKFYDYPVEVPEVLREKGVQVVEMNQIKRDLPRWVPTVADDPRFAEPVPLEERPDWKDEPAFTSHKTLRLFEGVKQACLIAKAQHFEGLPPAVERLLGAVDVPDRDLLLQRYIMQSQFWNTSEDKIPKRVDKRKLGWNFKREFGILPAHSSLILLRNLLRLCQSHVTQFPSLSNRRQIADSLLHSYVMYKGEPIVLKQTVNFMVTSDSMLSPFGDESVVDASVGHSIPDMWPVYPTVDFIPSNNYELNSLAGLSKEQSSSSSSSCLHPHTLVDIVTKDSWDDTHIQAHQVMACLMTAAAVARRKYGDDVTILPKPISIQHIALRETRLVCTYFQLNTLDLDGSNTGVKNLVWTPSQGWGLCEKILGQPWMPQAMKRMRLLDYDGSGFEPFLATYLNGCKELLSSDSDIDTSSSS